MTFWDGDRWVDEGADVAARARLRAKQPATLADRLATLAMVLVLLALPIPSMSVAAASSALSIAPGSGASGSKVQLTGSGLPAGSRLQVTWDGATVGMPSVQVKGNGTFKASLLVPKATLGGHVVATVRSTRTKSAGSGVSGSPLASTSFSVIASSVTPTPAPTATPAPTPRPTDPPAPSPTATARPTSSPAATPGATPGSTPAATPGATPAASNPPTPSPAPSTTPGGFVGASGTRLTLDGSPYRFAGVNLYNANSRDNCWYPLGYGDDDLAGALKLVPEVDAFRAWFYQGLALTNGQRDWRAFDHTLAVAAEQGKHVVVQLSGQGGDCGDYPRDVQKTDDWYRTGYRSAPALAGFTSYREWVAEFVARYASNRTILAYQLVGEAEAPSDQRGTCAEDTAAAALRAFVDDMGALVKSIDANHLVTLGVIGTGQCGTSGTNYTFVHASRGLDLCTTEDYGKPTAAMPGDQWNGMQVRLTQCGGLGKPLFVQESGIKLDAEAGGSTATRASLFADKLRTQFGAGVVGELLWDYVAPHDPIYGGGDSRGYDLLPGDPAIRLLGGY
jgi:hypothetical protein